MRPLGRKKEPDEAVLGLPAPVGTEFELWECARTRFLGKKRGIRKGKAGVREGEEQCRGSLCLRGEDLRRRCARTRFFCGECAERKKRTKRRAENWREQTEKIYARNAEFQRFETLKRNCEKRTK